MVMDNGRFPFNSCSLFCSSRPCAPCPLTLPICPFLEGRLFCLLNAGRVNADEELGTVGVRGGPGEVGGFDKGAELIECAALLCVLFGFPDTTERILVNVMLTVSGSPAK